MARDSEKFEEILSRAQSLSAAEREAYIEEACGGDDDLRREIIRELAHADDALAASRGEETIQTPPPGGPPSGPDDSLGEGQTATIASEGAGRAGGSSGIPSRIGKYRIRRVIASGGMGTVYEAVQEKPKRTVALKVMQRGIASRSALRRFEYESQILGRLRHPGIAQVYEAGTHRDGTAVLPYFVMEYIPNARPITNYCEEHGLDTGERLTLFSQVCDAVHHGHQKGIIHRDLKPENILVDSNGHPRVIDFGVARSTDSDMAVTTLQTEFGQLVGTLQYMSPEQVDADPNDIDTRSDVYSLGVILYELLGEKLPYDLSQTGIAEATRIIREERPPRLSTVNSRLRGDLEVIVAKALDKDRLRRYGSAAELSNDLGNYLKGHPIHARPPNLGYQVRMFARRNKALVTSGLMVLVILVAGIIVSTSMYFEAETARSAEAEQRVIAETAVVEAKRQADIAKAVNNFLNDDLLSAVAPEQQGIEVTMREVLDTASERIADRFEEEPEVEAAIRATLGNTYLALSVYDQSEPHMKRALDLRRAQFGPDHPDTLASMNSLGVLYLRRGRFEKAEPLLTEAVEKKRRIIGDSHEDTLTSMRSLALLYRSQGRYDEAENLLRETLGLYQEVLGEEHPETLTTMNNLALLLSNLRRYDEAEPLLVETFESRKRILGEEHPSALTSANNLALLYKRQQRFAEAEPLYVETLEVRERVLGEDHIFTLNSMNNLAQLYVSLERLDEAESLHNRSLGKRREVLGENHPDTLQSMNNLAILYRRRGKLDEAEALFVETVAAAKRVLGPSHPNTLTCMSLLAGTFEANGKLELAEETYTSAVTTCRASSSPALRGRLAGLLRSQGVVFAKLKRFDESERSLREAVEILERRDPFPKAEIANTMKALIAVYEAWEKPDQVEAWRKRLSELDRDR